ncbi:hypothetical protein DXG01_007980 [Tephrocybe rancida]|nr:hypothetical protein DXG01_007980 [Tephrocybe rancida]
MAISDVSPSTFRPPVAKPKPTISRSEIPTSPQKQTKAEKRSKRHRTEDKSEVPDDESIPEVTPKEKKTKKRKREAEVSVDEDNEQIDEEKSGKKSKKKSKRAKKTEPEPTTTLDVAPKKKRKNKTGFSDPSEDASLSEQSQKCLSYAFLQFHRPSKWKFNKARQNWLIRNIWSKEMVPEDHLPLLFGYLAKVQGGVRENLLQSCRTALEKPKIEAPSSDSTVPGEDAPTDPTPAPSAPPAPTPTEANHTKATRAQALIDLLASSDSVAP